MKEENKIWSGDIGLRLSGIVPKFSVDIYGPPYGTISEVLICNKCLKEASGFSCDNCGSSDISLTSPSLLAKKISERRNSKIDIILGDV